MKSYCLVPHACFESTLDLDGFERVGGYQVQRGSTAAPVIDMAFLGSRSP